MFGSGTLLKAELPWKSVCQIPGNRPGNRPQSSRGVEFDPSFPDRMGPGTRVWELWVPFDFSFWKESLMTENLLCKTRENLEQHLSDLAPRVWSNAAITR